MLKYLDSNVFIYALLSKDKKGEISRKILSELAHNRISATTSFLTWDEVVHVIKKYRGEIAINEGGKFLRFPNLVFINVDRNIIFEAQKIIFNFNLEPRDAIHVASALMNKCGEFVSDDADFDCIKGIKRVKLS